ncbi:hypothetical protein VTN77DRAFT_7025 [Rasamsonia byssochlamydoides]|uniref:uncharacterized protein n=1 Tax=Rasamsonia byssochlamydoides TaxID=89139 RepID=UPI003743B220
MARLTGFLVFSAIPAVILLHLLVSPYTKVEESFHIQAIHDILTYGIPSPGLSKDAILTRFRDQYDHFSFPGAVPRTFIGALALSGVSQPFIWLDKNVNRQLLARAMLGLFNAFALLSYASGLQRAFGKATAYWYLLFQASQFHVVYYASRTLSNMFAFGITTLALRLLLPDPTGPDRYRRRCRLSLSLLTIAGIVFRAELALLLATHTIFLFVTGRIRMQKDIIPAGVIGLLTGLTATVVVDSYFWQQFPLWPELAAFKFNVISGQASAWGTHPWYFYFANAIPRLLLNPLTYLVGIPLSLFLPSTRRASVSLVVPSLTYVALYSLQPHKEWRFIVYIIPPLTAAAALGTSYIWTHRTRSMAYRVLSILIPLSTLATFLISTFILLPASAANYPGGHALETLHVYAHGSQPVINVHMGNLACQTGVTRFLQLPPPLLHLPGRPDWKIPFLQGGSSTLWLYDKTEDETLKSTPEFWDRFDYVLAEDEREVTSKAADPKRWEVVEEVDGFAGLKVLPPGEHGTGKVEKEVFQTLLGENGVALFDLVRDTVRRYITRGWWAEIRMEPKIKILKHV